MTKPLKIVILTTRLPEDIWLINTLAEVSQIAGIILPKGRRYREYSTFYVLKRRLKKIGFFRLANQALLVAYRFVFERQKDKKSVEQLFTGKPHTSIEKKGFDILVTEDANSQVIRDFILSKTPDLVVVSNGPLLKKHVLEAAQGKIINLHPGFAPKYRGRYTSFWPIYNREPEFIGTTVHYIDSGVDTGSILLQQQVDFDPRDTLRTITLKQHWVGVDLLVKCLQDFENLSERARIQTDSAHSNYLAPGLSHYLKARRWLRQRTRAARHRARKGELI